MAYAPTAIYAWLAQHNDEKRLAGGAFLLAPDIAVTCAHVVCDHLGLGVSEPPTGLVLLNFPALGIKRQAHVVPNGWIEVEVEGGADVLRDVALLRLTEPVEMKGFGCVPLATSAPPGGGLARIWGAGPGWQATGQEVEAKLGQSLNHTGRLQLTNRDGHGVTTKQGFSGSPLFDDQMTVIWGMVQQVAASGDRVTLALGADRLQEALHRAGLSLASTAGGTEISSSSILSTSLPPSFSAERFVPAAPQINTTGPISSGSAVGRTMLTAVIMTALAVETEHVLRHLHNVSEHKVSGTVFMVGTFKYPSGAWRVVVGEAGAGNVATAILTERAINYFSPNVALFVGVAGGVKDCKIGDVAIANKVYGFESGKVTDNGFLVRPSTFMLAHNLDQLVRSAMRSDSWKSRLQYKLPEDRRQAFLGPIASGEKVVATIKDALNEFLRTSYNDTIAVEMEGRGFMEAIHVNAAAPGLVVRGISDLLSGKSQSDAADSQKLASDSAAAFAYELLAKLGDDSSLPSLLKSPPNSIKSSSITSDAKEKYQASATSTVEAACRELSREQRLENLKYEVLKILITSSIAMDALETEVSISANNQGMRREILEVRGKRLQDWLFDGLTFDAAVSALNKAYEKLKRSQGNDPSAVVVIKKTSSMLLPWLHIVGESIDCGKWEQKEIGAVLPIPAGLKSFAEIVMAGIDIRKATFNKIDEPEGWPYSSFALESTLPEEGISSVNIDTIRHDLMKRLGVPPDVYKRDEKEKDKSIKSRINYFLNNKNTRIFIICENRYEQVSETEIGDIIASLYPGIGVVRLAGDLDQDQNQFDRIRHLLDFESN